MNSYLQRKMNTHLRLACGAGKSHNCDVWLRVVSHPPHQPWLSGQHQCQTLWYILEGTCDSRAEKEEEQKQENTVDLLSICI